jgi:hypothetical protein
MSTEIDRIVGELPIEHLAAQVGESPDAVRAAATQAMPMILGGLQQHAENPQLHSLVDAHAAGTASTAPSQDMVDQFVGTQARGFADSNPLVKKLMPYLLPLVVSVVAKRVGGKNAGAMGAVLSTVLAGAAGGMGGTSSGSTGSILSKIVKSVFRR